MTTQPLDPFAYVTPSYRAKLVRTAARYSPSNADDIVQLALIAVWSKPDYQSEPGTMQVLKTTAINFKLQESAKLARVSRQLKPTDEASNGAPSIERRMVSRAALKSIVASASPKMRQILDALADGDDCPTIAARLNMPATNVRKALSRFRSHAR